MTDAFIEFVRSSPAVVQDLMRTWPPLAVVRTRPGVILLVPAPGVEGMIHSYFENGTLGVVAPAALAHPVHGWGAAKPGELLKAAVWPEQLEYVRASKWTRADVEQALS